MCGICGACFERSGEPVQRQWVEQMCSRIVHRGPDDEGIWVDRSVGLGMRRLSIIDLEGGSQPMFNEDETVGVVFNGEIYNFQQLRESLITRGHRFQTQSDTEVIVHLYEEYGQEFVTRLNGMFAIALWDGRQRRLLLFRDRLGKKPLYYAWLERGLVFGSELKSVLSCPGVRSQLDHEAVYHYFTLGYIPHPWSVYRGVRQLPPAGRLVAQGDHMRVDRYWSLDPQPVHGHADCGEVAERLRGLLRDAVRIRMISDVPLGAFLSGGLDSSIIVALMAQISDVPVKTFHIDFAEPDYSERKYARAVAQRYATEHHEMVVKPSAVEVLDRLVEHFDEPFGDSSAVPTYYVSQLTREHVTVALAGDGGDEGFGGYERYQRILRRRSFSPWLRRGLGLLGESIHRCVPRSGPGRRYFRSLGMDNPRFFALGTFECEAREMLSLEFLETLGAVSTYESVYVDCGSNGSKDPLAPYTSMDICHYLPDDILTKVDRMSMAHSLELRAPFLDYRVVELAASLPWDWKIQGPVTKWLLKRTFASDLPAEVTAQRKWGFAIPVEQWLRHELRPMLMEALHDPGVAASGIFRMEEVRAIADEHFHGRRDRSEQLWRFLFFTRWWHHQHPLSAATGVQVGSPAGCRAPGL